MGSASPLLSFPSFAAPEADDSLAAAVKSKASLNLMESTIQSTGVAAHAILSAQAYIQCFMGEIPCHPPSPEEWSSWRSSVKDSLKNSGLSPLLEATTCLASISNGCVEDDFKGGDQRSRSNLPFFCFKHFYCPKKDGGNRPIINLKPLNSLFLSLPHFKMDTVKDVASLLQPGDFEAPIDLKDAYFHLPIHPSQRKYLRFIWRGRLYEFLVLPFSLCTASFVFSKITNRFTRVQRFLL